MLYTGLTTDFQLISRYGRRVVVTSILGILSMFTLTYIYLALRGFDTAVAVFVSITLSNTAMETAAAILVREKSDVLKSFVVGSSIVDDIIVAAALPVVAKGGALRGGFLEVLYIVALTALFIVVVLQISQILVSRYPGFYKLIAKNYFTFTTAALALTFALSYASAVVGLGEFIGAYLAGLLLARNKDVHDPMLRSRVAVARLTSELATYLDAVFIPLFFVSVGLSYSISGVELSTYTVLTLLALFGKFPVIYSYAYRITGDKRSAVAAAIAMAGRGSLEIALLKLGLESKLLTPELFSTVLSVSLTTTILSPLLYSAVKRE